MGPLIRDMWNCSYPSFHPSTGNGRIQMCSPLALTMDESQSTNERLRGGDLGGTGGTVPPQNLRWGTAHALVPPNILRSSVVGCAWKYEQSENGGFLVRKWSYTTFNIVNIRKMWEKKGKIRRTKSMTKKKVIRNFYPENGHFPEIGPWKFFWVPPKFGARSPPMAMCDLKIHNSVTTFVSAYVYRQLKNEDLQGNIFTSDAWMQRGRLEGELGHETVTTFVYLVPVPVPCLVNEESYVDGSGSCKTLLNRKGRK